MMTTMSIPAPLHDRLVELYSLPPGWDGDDAKTVSDETYAGACRIVKEALKRDLPMPGIYPMSEGGLSLEWASPKAVLSIEVLGELATFQILDVSKPDNFIFTSDVGLADATDRILSAVQEFTKKGLLAA